MGSKQKNYLKYGFKLNPAPLLEKWITFSDYHRKYELKVYDFKNLEGLEAIKWINLIVSGLDDVLRVKKEIN